MIAANTRTRQTQPVSAPVLHDPSVLLQRLQLSSALLPAIDEAAATFPLRIPQDFLARIRVGDIDDPLLRQVLPQAAELEDVAGFSADPLAEQHALVAPGVLHKYPGRALLIVTGACAIHCRYCFRREFPYAAAQPTMVDWQPALDYLRADPSLREVILSGGDPLTLSNQRLARLFDGLESIPHLQRLRIHSRIPVVLPQRIDDGLLVCLEKTKLQPILVIHANHPREIDTAVVQSLRGLARVGITLFNQSVLLRGINDDAAVLAELSEVLFAARVTPYYLHMLDPVRGTAHFAVKESVALAIMKALRERLPGYLVPRLVREQPGQLAKTPVEHACC